MMININIYIIVIGFSPTITVNSRLLPAGNPLKIKNTMCPDFLFITNGTFLILL